MLAGPYGMCNNFAFSKRVPALLTATFSSTALVFLVFTGITCSFVEVQAKPGEILFLPDSNDHHVVESACIGVLFGNEYYNVEKDLLWKMSRLSLYISLALGSLTTLHSWAISTCIPPTDVKWKLLSMMSAISAIVQMPMFLLFEIDPCKLYTSQQICQLSYGSFFLIMSTVFWIAVTMATQCLDPPLWAVELDAWRVPRKSEEFAKIECHQQNESAPSRKKWTYRTGFQNCCGIQWGNSEDLQQVRTDSMPEEDCPVETNERNFALQGFVENDSYYARSDCSRLMLQIKADEKRPGDESKSVASFEDLDSFVELAEEGDILSDSSTSSRRRDDSTSDELEWKNEQTSMVVLDISENSPDDPEEPTSVIHKMHVKDITYNKPISVCLGDADETALPSPNQSYILQTPRLARLSLGRFKRGAYQKIESPPDSPKSGIGMKSPIAILTDRLRQNTRWRKKECSDSVKDSIADDNTSSFPGEFDFESKMSKSLSDGEQQLLDDWNTLHGLANPDKRKISPEPRDDSISVGVGMNGGFVASNRTLEHSEEESICSATSESSDASNTYRISQLETQEILNSKTRGRRSCRDFFWETDDVEEIEEPPRCLPRSHSAPPAERDRSASQGCSTDRSSPNSFPLSPTRLPHTQTVSPSPSQASDHDNLSVPPVKCQNDSFQSDLSKPSFQKDAASNHNLRQEPKVDSSAGGTRNFLVSEDLPDITLSSIPFTSELSNIIHADSSAIMSRDSGCPARTAIAESDPSLDSDIICNVSSKVSKVNGEHRRVNSTPQLDFLPKKISPEKEAFSLEQERALQPSIFDRPSHAEQFSEVDSQSSCSPMKVREARRRRLEKDINRRRSRTLDPPSRCRHTDLNIHMAAEISP